MIAEMVCSGLDVLLRAADERTMDMAKRYRIYFRNAQGWIEACEDFRAESDQSAAIIGSWLFDACSNRCADYDVWCGRQRVDGEMPPAIMRAPSNARMRAALQRAAEALLKAGWKIAQSERLLELVGQLQRSHDQSAFGPWTQSRAAAGVDHEVVGHGGKFAGREQSAGPLSA
jgi:hypothetical protein